MKIYIDMIFIINLLFDFILLLTSSIILKRNTKLIRIILGSLFGSLSLLILFVRLNSISLLLYKIIISIFMIIITFGFKNIKYFITNIYYLYLISIIMGGIIYFINNQFSYNCGLVFFNSYKYNILLGFILTVIGLFIYIRSIKKLKTNFNKYLNATIYFKEYKVEVSAFLDTGNLLKDPYLFRPIILVNKNKIKEKDDYLLVPYKSLNDNHLLKCIKAKKIYIDGVGYRNNFLIGLSNEINIDGVDCILNEKLLEG